MNVFEAKNEFSTFFNNIANNAAPGIDDYELGVLFTTAQNQIVRELYTGSGSFSAFEEDEEVRRYLEALVQQKDYTAAESAEGLPDNKYRHTVFSLPSNCWYIVYEQASLSTGTTCMSGRVLDVIPTTHDEYLKTRENPFRGPSKREILRLDKGSSQVELVSIDDIDRYTIRYISEPKPIIISDLYGTDSIDGNTQAGEIFSELPTSLHRTIVMRAVQLAAATIEGIIKRTN